MLNHIMYLITKIIRAKDHASLSRLLKDLICSVLALNSELWGDVLDEVANRLTDEFSQPHVIEGKSDQTLFEVVDGIEATRLYIANEIGTSPSVDPLWSLSRISHLAAACKKADEGPIDNLEHISAILAHCFNTFPALSTTGMSITIAIPDIDIDCTAACAPYYDNEGFTMFINKDETEIFESFTYEAVALSLFSGWDVPSAAIDLLEQTTSPNIKEMPEDDKYNEYITALKLGLCCDGPYQEQVELWAEHHVYSRRWAEYIQTMLPN